MKVKEILQKYTEILRFLPLNHGKGGIFAVGNFICCRVRK